MGFSSSNQLAKVSETLTPATGSSAQVGFDPANVELYEYDGFNRLMRSNVNGEEASYTYRVDGLRNSKTSATGTTTHLWDGANIVADLNGGTVVARYVRGVNLLFSYSSAGQKFYLYNGHGNVVQLASSTGAILWRYDYDGFGNEREIAGQDPAQDANPFRYCGEYFDKETGSIYLRARYYNPVMGRFYSEDPIRDGLNWYAYGSNNPLFYLDPFGLAIVPIRDFVTKYGGSFQSYDKLRASVFAIGNINLSVLWTGYNTAGINITNNNGYLSADSSDLFTFFENAIVPSIEEEYLISPFGAFLETIPIVNYGQAAIGRNLDRQVLTTEQRLEKLEQGLTASVDAIERAAIMGGTIQNVGSVSAGGGNFIKHSAYNDMRNKIGEKGANQFINAMNKGVVGPQGQSGIKILSGNGVKIGNVTYQYEVKLYGELANYRLYGNLDNMTGQIVFSFFGKALH